MEEHGNGGQVLVAAGPAEGLHEAENRGPVVLGREGAGIGHLDAVRQQGQAVGERGVEQRSFLLEEMVEGAAGEIGLREDLDVFPI